MTEPKKIKLNFGGMAAKAVGDIAAATCGPAVAESLRRVFVSSNIRRMQQEMGALQMLLGSGLQALDEATGLIGRTDCAIRELENLTPAELGGVAGKGYLEQKMSSLRLDVTSCNAAITDLTLKTRRMRDMIEGKERRDAEVYAAAEQLGGAEGKEAQALKEDFETSAGRAKKLVTDSNAVVASGENTYDKAMSLMSYKSSQIAEAERKEAYRRHAEEERRRHEEYSRNRPSPGYSWGSSGW